MFDWKEPHVLADNKRKLKVDEARLTIYVLDENRESVLLSMLKQDLLCGAARMEAEEILRTKGKV